MRLVLIRHGKQDYTIPEGKGFFLALPENSRLYPPPWVSNKPRLSLWTHASRGAQLIVSSPYTRALQTGAIISRVTGLKIEIAFDLHEWIIDTTYQNKTSRTSSMRLRKSINSKAFVTQMPSCTGKVMTSSPSAPIKPFTLICITIKSSSLPIHT